MSGSGVDIKPAQTDRWTKQRDSCRSSFEMKMLTFERKLLNPQLRTWVFWWPAGRAVCWAGVSGAVTAKAGNGAARRPGIGPFLRLLLLPDAPNHPSIFSIPTIFQSGTIKTHTEATTHVQNATSIYFCMDEFFGRRED